jgi:hypothetical protein
VGTGDDDNVVGIAVHGIVVVFSTITTALAAMVVDMPIMEEDGDMLYIPSNKNHK